MGETVPRTESVPGSPATDGVTLPDIVRARALEHPERVAVMDVEGQLTYAELARAADRVATRLLRVGVRPGDYVGVALDRSARMLVGLLGVLRAGAAYVPLDPDFPDARLALMVEDASLRFVVSEPDVTSDAFGSLHRIELDGTDSDGPIDALPEVSPEMRAYLIYTSGSTGRPKGVRVLHRNLVNLLESMVEEPGVSSDDRWLAVTTLSFDISALELLGPLVAGATTCIASSEQCRDGEGVRAALEASDATILQATPLMWRLLVETGWSDSRLKALSGGEALPRDLALELLERAGPVWNLYGPTETTIWSTIHRVRLDAPTSIGRPIRATTVHVLDEELRPVPPGVPGELFIGGDGVTDGYHERPDLTDERFVPDPFADSPGARMYRTGDRVRMLRDETLEFRGRADTQVKIRGFRVELGEIENHLGERADVRRAAVVVRRDDRGVDRLAVFFESPEAPPYEVDLRAHLLERVPAYMVPDLWISVETLPATPNGKIDRRALERRAMDLGSTDRPFVEPEGPTERLIADAMAEVLGREGIGALDDLFDLGGHSIHVMRLLALLRDRLTPDLGFRDIFTAPTVRGIAARVASRSPGDDALEEFVF